MSPCFERDQARRIDSYCERLIGDRGHIRRAYERSWRAHALADSRARRRRHIDMAPSSSLSLMEAVMRSSLIH